MGKEFQENTDVTRTASGAPAVMNSGSPDDLRPSPRLTFPKSERLRHKTLVDSLFAGGKKKFEYPLRILCKTWSEKELKESFKVSVPDRMAPLQVMITVPKRKIRHAVDRVRIRRMIREAWRLNRRVLRDAVAANPDCRLLGVALVYMADEMVPMTRLEMKVRNAIAALKDTLLSDKQP